MYLISYRLMKSKLGHQNSENFHKICQKMGDGLKTILTTEYFFGLK